MGQPGQRCSVVAEHILIDRSAVRECSAAGVLPEGEVGPSGWERERAGAVPSHPQRVLPECLVRVRALVPPARARVHNSQPTRSYRDLGQECAHPRHQLRRRHVVTRVQRLAARARPARPRRLHVHDGRQRLAIVGELGVIEEEVGLGLTRAGVGLGSMVGADDQSLCFGLGVVGGEVGIRCACLLAGADVGEADAIGPDGRPVHYALVERHVNAGHRVPSRSSEAQKRIGSHGWQHHPNLRQENHNRHQRADQTEQAPPQGNTEAPRHAPTVTPPAVPSIGNTPRAPGTNHLAGAHTVSAVPRGHTRTLVPISTRSPSRAVAFALSEESRVSTEAGLARPRPCDTPYRRQWRYARTSTSCSRAV